MKKIWREPHCLVVSHWASCATKNEFAFEEKAHPLLLSQAWQARLGMTKRVHEGSITLDDNDSQSLEVARQEGTGLFTIRIDHFVYDDNVCNLLFGDLVIDSGAKPDVNNVARGPHQLCSPDCFTHAMVDDSRRLFPRSVLQADTLIVSCGLANCEHTFWSTQRCDKFGGNLATAANTHKFLESFEDNYPRSAWMIDYRKLDDPDNDKSLRKHIGRTLDGTQGS